VTWQTVKLGELARVRTGKLDANAADENGHYPFFTCAVEPLSINTPAFDCKAILVAGNGDLNVKYYEGKFNAYQRTYVIESLDEKKLLPRYLYLFLNEYVNELRALAIGGVIKYIKLENLTDAPIPLPTLAEQQRIASILDKAQEIKCKRELAIEKLDRLAESVFYEMFGDPLNNEKNWQQKSLGDVLTLITYGLTVRPNYVDVGIPLISAREIRNGSVNIQNGPKISRSDYDNLSDKSKPSFGDILFSKTGSIGHCALVETKIPFAVTQNAARLSFEKSTVNTVFALNYLRFGSIQGLAQRSARGNAVKDLQLGVMKQFPFPLPPLSLQDQFAKRIEKLDQLKVDSITALIKQKQLFLTLEHQAFSGQL
jgi:type I restriction enzyme S subunit